MHNLLGSLHTYQLQFMTEGSLLLRANAVGLADLGSTEDMVRPLVRTILLETQPEEWSCAEVDLQALDIQHLAKAVADRLQR